MAPRTRAALAYVGLFAAVGAQAQYLILYYRSLGFDLAASGRIFSLAALIGLAAAPLWGSFSDRLRGAPIVLAGATVLAATGAVALSQGGSLPLVVLSAAALAAGIGGVVPILDARALETAGDDRAGYGWVRAWGSVAYIVAAAGTGAAIDRWGIGVMFAILAAALLFTGAIGLTLRPAITHTADRPLRAAARLFGLRGLGLFLVGAFLAWLTMSAVMTFLPIRFQELAAPAAVVGVAAALGAAVEVPIMLRFRSLAARFGAHRLLIAGASMFAVRALIAATVPDPAVLVASAVLAGIGFALMLVGGVTWVAAHAPPELAASAQGIFHGVSVGLAQVTAGSIGGAIGGAVGLTGLYLLAAGLGIVATVMVAVAVRRGSAHGRGAAPLATAAGAD